MAALGLFINFTESEVKTILAGAKEIFMTQGGKTIMSYGDQGTNATKAFAMPVKEVIEECNHALRVLNPEKYGSIKGTRRSHSNYGATAMKS